MNRSRKKEPLPRVSCYSKTPSQGRKLRCKSSVCQTSYSATFDHRFVLLVPLPLMNLQRGARSKTVPLANSRPSIYLIGGHANRQWTLRARGRALSLEGARFACILQPEPPPSLSHATAAFWFYFEALRCTA